MASPSDRAESLLTSIRRTPMTFGRLNESKRLLRDRIANAIRNANVSEQLARRIALQLVLKVKPASLDSRRTWLAIGTKLFVEIQHLTQLGLGDRQITLALPKLSAVTVDGLLAELRAEDLTIARTILNATLDAAEPVAAAKRYLRQFHRVTRRLRTLDPGIARTIANATFMARTPAQTAAAHYRRFAQLFATFHDDVVFARTVAKRACRSSNPLVAAERVIAAYHTTRGALVAAGCPADALRSLAGIASVAARPEQKARGPLQNFNTSVAIVQKTHPAIANRVALAACRATHPETATRLYLDNYDDILRLATRTNPRRAHAIALQACCSHRAIDWAARLLSADSPADDSD